MQPYNPKVCLNEQVVQVEKQGDGSFKLTSNTTVHYSRSILIAGGIGAFTPRRLPAANTEMFEGKGIHYFIDDLSKFKNMNCLVVGGGDSAVDFALMLETVAKKVTLIHRRDAFRAHEDSVRKLFSSSVEIRVFSELKAVEGTERVERALVVNSKEKTEEEVQVQAIIGALGFSASLGPILNWGLEVKDNAIIVNTKGETNIPGIYAVGDIVTYPGKIKLIATGFGEGPTAVNNAKLYLDPESKLHPGHSSSGFGKK
jgi:thioredoxin reductase (NADPH)